MEAGVTSVDVQIDRQALLDKYQFVWDHAPRMWLAEKDTDGWWPLEIEEFFERVEGANHDGRLRLTTREPLQSAFHPGLKFLHGKRPSNGVGPSMKTFVLPMGADEENDPLEMLLNPEANPIEVAYIYFMPYDQVRFRLDNHVGDIEKTKVQFVNGEPTVVDTSFHQFHR